MNDAAASFSPRTGKPPPRDESARTSEVEALFRQRYERRARRTDRMLAKLMLVQWAAAIVLALWLSPYAWAGKSRVLHTHVWAALVLGGAISSLPVFLAVRFPGRVATRHILGCGQMLWSALLIHLTGGRIETHFHIFGSLAILSFYRDLAVLVPATIIVALDHFVRGAYWPESVYGVLNPEWWRFLEHAAWVGFLDTFLVMSCIRGRAELYEICEQQVELQATRDAQARVERLAALGQLAASVGHELRNPLAAIRNAETWLRRKLPVGQTVEVEPRVRQFLDIMERELDASSRIITNLLDFARARVPAQTPCPLRPLVDEVLGLVIARDDVRLSNQVPADLEEPEIDKDQFRQVILNLVQNAVEAMPAGRSGEVIIAAEGGGAAPWRITVQDDGQGMPPSVIDKIFQPLFSTKTKGTGLGLAVVAGIVERHAGRISVESEVGVGTCFVIELPARTELLVRAVA